MSFRNFLADMGESPDGLTIDRINNDGDYEPANCRWVSKAVQNGNSRKNVFVEIDGVRLHLCEWARRLGVNPSNICRVRRQRGLSTEEAIRHYMNRFPI